MKESFTLNEFYDPKLTPSLYCSGLLGNQLFWCEKKSAKLQINCSPIDQTPIASLVPCDQSQLENIIAQS